ncbi:hypothetical protein SAMN04488490_0147 [Marinobacter sp. LV10R510-11A]|uniref:hypothetical protein n=1 Tax=Marinobacter sp. LV10R510-11A TaxID=1415568 RepID=UPI000BB808B5|nr:hypothetical protein [Marinobacter sp. LV10R510-11A]SOB74643.1 hypothetical protein SAMN04488490_0147 [Marinobacter sp. LV10R510-11A]
MRLTRAEENEFNGRLSLALAEYAEMVSRWEKPSADHLIVKHDLRKSKKLITSKRFQNIVYKTPSLRSYFSLIKERNRAIERDLAKGADISSILKNYSISEYQLKSLIRNSAHSPLDESSKKHTDDVCRMYNGQISVKLISETLNICTHTVSKILKINSIDRRSQLQTSVRYSGMNADYFRKIDCPEKAWVLGFIFADGSINQLRDVQISQSIEHSHVLQIIADQLNYPGAFTLASKSHTPKKQAILCLSRRKMAEDLLKLGMTEQKDADLRFPFSKMSPDLYWSFLSGFYNGDGGLTLGVKRNSLVQNGSPGWNVTLGWQITSTMKMCEDIAAFLRSEIKGIVHDIRKEGSKNAWRVSITSSRRHILEVVQKLDSHGFGIQISDKHDKAVFFQRRKRRNEAFRAVLYHPEANLFKGHLSGRVEALRAEGKKLVEIASSLSTDRSYLRNLYNGERFPRTQKVIDRFTQALSISEHDFVDWSLLSALRVVDAPWKLKDESYTYHGRAVGCFGEVLEFFETKQ